MEGEKRLAMAFPGQFNGRYLRNCVTVSGASETSNVVALQWQLAFMVMTPPSRLLRASAARQHKEALLTTVCRQTRLACVGRVAPRFNPFDACRYPKPLRTLESGHGPRSKLLGDMHQNDDGGTNRQMVFPSLAPATEHQ